MIIATNGYIGITHIIYDIDNYVVLADGTERKIEYNEDGETGFMLDDEFYNLNEFVRTNLGGK